MALKSFVIILSIFIVVKCAPSPAPPCICEEDEAYLEKFWEFYNSDTKVNAGAVPGELSPLVYCSNCMEYNRRKRKTDTENEGPDAPRKVADVTETPRTIAEIPDPEYGDYNDDTRPGIEDPLCPSGTKRIGRWCA